MSEHVLEGVYTAIVTPFAGDEVDREALADLVERQIEAGVSGIVPCGTTGEASTLDPGEHLDVIRTVVETVDGRVQVMAGTGANATREAVHLTAEARSIGVDSALLVCPYYNRPTQEGLYRHYVAVADRVDLPLVLYNIPSRTGRAIEVETMVRLADHPNVRGLKEASGDVCVAAAVARATDLAVLSGDDARNLPILSVGGAGVVSVASNVVPGEVVSLVDAFGRGESGEALRVDRRLAPLVEALFLETNPGPVKQALALLDLCSPDVRLPLTECGPSTRERLRAVLEDRGLI